MSRRGNAVSLYRCDLTVFVSSISSLLYFIVDKMYLYDHSNTLIILNCIISPTPKSLSIYYIHLYNLITLYSSITPILQSLSINYPYSYNLITPILQSLSIIINNTLIFLYFLAYTTWATTTIVTLRRNICLD